MLHADSDNPTLSEQLAGLHVMPCPMCRAGRAVELKGHGCPGAQPVQGGGVVPQGAGATLAWAVVLLITAVRQCVEDWCGITSRRVVLRYTAQGRELTEGAARERRVAMMQGTIVHQSRGEAKTVRSTCEHQQATCGELKHIHGSAPLRRCTWLPTAESRSCGGMGQQQPCLRRQLGEARVAPPLETPP